MFIKWTEETNPYKAVREAIFKKIGFTTESLIVQLRIKYAGDKEWKYISELLINDADEPIDPEYIWENDWWEGQQCIELIAVAKTSGCSFYRPCWIVL